MLSLLIPIYNHDSSSLIRSLRQQAEASSLDWELVAMEDGSTLCVSANEEACQLSSRVHYIYNKENVGRAAIRNRLASVAHGDWLIFVDCDSSIDDPLWLSRYAAAIAQADTDAILCGGRKYRPASAYPANCQLHWLVGSHREPRVSKEAPVRNFTSNNFAVSKSFFEEHPFDETILTYGHEDTLFGFQALRAGAHYEYVDAVVIHDTLDPDPTFLAKAEQSFRNMALIEPKLLPHEVDQLRLLRVKNRLRPWGILWLLKRLSPLLLPRLKQRLLGPQKTLKDFDLYKITYLSTLF